MINENFVFLGFALTFIGTVSYIRGILRGEVKPNIVTWLLWGTAPLLAFSAQITEGAGLRAVHAFSTAFGPLLIVFFALMKKNAFAKISRLDYLYGAFSVLGLLFWQITGEGVIAIIFAIAADTFAALPTIRKLYFEPDTESGWIFGLGSIAATIALLTITDWRFEEYGFSLYILIITLVMFFPTARRSIINRSNLKGVK